MENSVNLVAVTKGVFKENHRFQGANGQWIIALETDVLYTSMNQVTNTIKVMVFKDTVIEKMLSKSGELVTIKGKLRNFNKDSWGKRINEVFVQPTWVDIFAKKNKQQNKVELVGKVCGDVTFKTRTSGKLVAERIVKVTRENGGSDYIPVVAFDEEALKLRNATQGQNISLTGRIHSRTYPFKYREEGVQKEVLRTALEVGVHKCDLQPIQEEVPKPNGHWFRSVIDKSYLERSGRHTKSVVQQIGRSNRIG